MPPVDRWQDAPKGQVHERVIDYVSSVESAQSDVYERFLKLACLYDPHDRMGMAGGWWTDGRYGSGFDYQVTENVCASNVDTVAAIISRSQPRVRFMTDDGDWSTQRTARRLEWYAEGVSKLVDLFPKAQRAFKDSAIFGTGLLKVWCDGKKIHVERVLIDEIVVDEGECKCGSPRQLHHRKLVDRGVLRARFPEHADAIDKAQSEANGTTGSWRWWADYRPLERDQVVVIESYQLPVGEPDDDDYVAGRWTICIDGATLQDEEWDKSYFPFAKIVWSERTTGWYGIGLLERIAGHQRTLNKLNWQIDRILDQHAVPTTWVQMADAGIRAKDINRFGTIGVYKAQPPITVQPQNVTGEQSKRAADVKNSSYEESGVSRLSASSLKPAGLESAVAMREYKDTTTERFAIQEQAYERFILDATWLIVACAKELGKNAPNIVRRSKMGSKKIAWADVDLGEARVQMAAASNIARTPAGRTQSVIEWAQAGVISQDEARRLLQHPDLERAMSLYTAALEDIERCIEEILDGEDMVPEPYQNLKMGIWRMQQAYLKAKADGAPETVCEGLRTWMVQAAFIVNPPAPPMPQAPMSGQPMPVEPPIDPMMAGAPVDPAMLPPVDPSMGTAPAPAFAPQAMQIAPV